MPVLEKSSDSPSWRTQMALILWRLGPGLRIPARFLIPGLPSINANTLPARKGPLSIEIVSHCWNYSHLLAYQVSSLLENPTRRIRLTVTVCYCREDSATVALLDFFGKREVPGITWNWLALEKGDLMRRAIGRNRAALASKADWVWFTDCDLVFGPGCLDGLADGLEGRNDPLVYPREERCTGLLTSDDPILLAAAGDPTIVSIDPAQFEVRRPRKATGPLQITHGDVARQFGYCAVSRAYQTPTVRWRKAYEDRVFRWLLNTHGVPLDLPGVYRVMHLKKGRYDDGILSRVRSIVHFKIPQPQDLGASLNRIRASIRRRVK